MCFLWPRAIKMNLENEGLEKAREEAEKNAKKRKADEDKLWEGVFPPFCIFLPPFSPFLLRFPRLQCIILREL